MLQITSYNLVAVTETCREGSHDWSITDDGLKLFRRDGQGRRGGRVALDIKKLIDYTELPSSVGPSTSSREGQGLSKTSQGHAWG